MNRTSLEFPPLSGCDRLVSEPGYRELGPEVLAGLLPNHEEGERVGRGEKGRGPKGGDDDRVDELNGQGKDNGAGANGNVEGVNGSIRTLSREVAVSVSWNDFKFMMIEELCPSHEMQKLETELWNHVMVRVGHAAYTDRFHELARLVPHLVTPESRKIERYVYSLALQIRGMVTAIEPKTMQKAV
ncbi:reverse transcriptase domain-containing protein [Tanacetum coccineum]